MGANGFGAPPPPQPYRYPTAAQHDAQQPYRYPDASTAVSVETNPPAKLFRNFLKTEIENQKRGSCDFER
jgi:hypothetical protein